jgi:hypothetical protein
VDERCDGQIKSADRNHQPPRLRRGRTGSTDRAAGSANSLLPRAPETIGRSASPQKKCGWPPAALPSLCRSRTSTPARASSTRAPCLRPPNRSDPGNRRKRHEKPLLPLLPLRETLSFSASADRLSLARADRHRQNRMLGRGERGGSGILHASAGYVRARRRASIRMHKGSGIHPADDADLRIYRIGQFGARLARPGSE